MRLLIAIALITVALAPLITSGGECTPAQPRLVTTYMDGDWVVNTHVTRNAETIILNGNLIVNNTGFLELSNVIFMMNCSFDGEFVIAVTEGCGMALSGGSVITVNLTYNYSFQVRESSRLWMNDSSMDHCGFRNISLGNWSPGLVLDNSRADFLRGNISDNWAFLNANGSIINMNGTKAYNNTFGLTLNQSTVTLIDCDINGSPATGLDFRFNQAYGNFINTTSRWNQFAFADGNSRINVSWYITVRTLFLDGTPAPDVNVSFRDVFNNEKLKRKSDAAGYATRKGTLQELFRTQQTTSSDSPYTLKSEWKGISYNITGQVRLNGTVDVVIGVDSTPPVIVVTEPSSGYMNRTSVIFRGMASDNQFVNLVDLSKDNGINWATATSLGDQNNPWSAWSCMLQLAEGPYKQVLVRATDSAGITNRTTVVLNIDITEPNIEIFSPAPGCITNAISIVISGKTDPSANLSVNGVPFLTSNGYFNVTQALLAGWNSFMFAAQDIAGNIGKETVVIYRDSQAPNITITAPVNNFLTNISHVLVKGTTDVDATVVVTGDTSSLPIDPDGTFMVTIDLQREGSTRIELRARDLAGNENIVAVTVYLDQTPPPLSAWPATPLTNQSTVTIIGETELDANASIAGVQVPLAVNNTFQSAVSIVPGLNQVIVTVSDKAGNRNSTVVEVTMDNTPPQALIKSPGAGEVVNAPEVEVSGTADDPSGVLAVEVGINDMGFTFCTGTNSWKGRVVLPVGISTITVRVRDTAGNVGRETRGITYKLPAPDILPPTVRVSQPNVVETTEKQLKVKGTATDPAGVTSVELSIDGQSWTACSVDSMGEFQGYVQLKPGPNRVTIRSADALGNQGTSFVIIEYLVAMPPKKTDYTLVIVAAVIAGALGAVGAVMMVRKGKSIENPEPALGEETAVMSFPSRSFKG